MSPARVIAPAVAFGVYSHMLAPLLGTILGGMGAGMMYSYLYFFKPDYVPDACVPVRSARMRTRACASHSRVCVPLARVRLLSRQALPACPSACVAFANANANATQADGKGISLV
jgi:hypothetical protein